MPKIIVLRLHPEEPVTGPDFAAYLTKRTPGNPNDASGDLSIDALDVSFDNRNGQLIGSARFLPNPAQTRILQHQGQVPPLPPFPVSVATAIIEITSPPAAEYANPDIVLRVKRGTNTVARYAVDYNVAVVDGSIPPAVDFDTFGPVGAFVPLPDPLLALDPDDAVVTLPRDGAPPNFGDLKAAVEKVLSRDPGGLPDLANLTPAQCRHIAYEIVWNRRLHPLPRPKKSLDVMYTVDSLLGHDDNARQIFEAELTKYRVTHDAQAETLARYVFALSAALACEGKSQDASRAGLRFPVRPGVIDPSGTVKRADVVLKS